MIPILATIAEALAVCPSGPAEVLSTTDRAVAAWGALDQQGFEAARAQLLEELACVGAPLSGALVARVHGVGALAAILEKDDARAFAALRAARSADPGYALPAAVPEGHRLWGMLTEADPSSVTSQLVPAPVGTRVVVDARASTARPMDRPAVLWLELQEGGAVVWSGLYPPDRALPDLSVHAVEPPAPEVVARARRGFRPSLVIASAAAAVGTGVCYGLAASSAGRFADPATPVEDLPRLRSRTNAYTVLGGVGVGLTVTLGTATVLARTESR